MKQVQTQNTNKFLFAFFGTPELSKDTLEILEQNGYIPAIIVTNEDALSGRGMQIHESPVSIWAKNHNITCLKPHKIDDEFIQNFEKYNIELSIVVAYGKIIPEKLIQSPKLGTVNIHYSLLPQYRGASPLEQALLNGDTQTGVSIQQMAYKLDSGPIIAESVVPIGIEDTKEMLRKKLTEIGGEVLCNTIPQIINKTIDPITQDESKATHCKKIKKEDGFITLDDSPFQNYNKYRAFYGWPGVYFFIEKNDKKIRVKINKASYKDDKFIIEKVTPEGKKEISYQEFEKNYL